MNFGAGEMLSMAPPHSINGKQSGQRGPDRNPTTVYAGPFASAQRGPSFPTPPPNYSTPPPIRYDSFHQDVRSVHISFSFSPERELCIGHFAYNNDAKHI